LAAPRISTLQAVDQRRPVPRSSANGALTPEALSVVSTAVAAGVALGASRKVRVARKARGGEENAGTGIWDREREHVAGTGTGNREEKAGTGTWDREAWLNGYESADAEKCYTMASADLPADLKGTYFRNGPAKFKVGPDQIRHPFDGDGMVSAVTFDGSGKAHFRNRFVRTKGFVEELKEGKMLYRGQFSPKAGGWMAN
ncbi:unnamed protein product, partial [Polarella glacialis]